MKSTILFLQIFFFVILFVACSNPIADERFQFRKDYEGTVIKDCIPAHSCQTEIDKKSVIRLDDGDDPSQVNPVYRGDKTVISFEMRFNDDPLLGDDEVLDRVQFEIKEGVDHFYYKDAELQQIDALFTRIAPSMEQGFYAIRKGLFEGHQNEDGSWTVFMHFHIVTKGRVSVTVDRALVVEVGGGV